MAEWLRYKKDLRSCPTPDNRKKISERISKGNLKISPGDWRVSEYSTWERRRKI